MQRQGSIEHGAGGVITNQLSSGIVSEIDPRRDTAQKGQ
jgi:hypothetical protein